MKLSEAVKHRGSPFWIPDCVRSELPEFFRELGFKKGVEIGVSWAENIIDYCKAGLEIYGIDPWKDSEDNIYRKIVSIPGNRAKTIETVHDYALERTIKYPNCKLVQKTSMEALADFPKRSLDFVYIDGNHAFGYVAMDLMKWADKVKKGGIIAGHDYFSTRGIRKLRQVGCVIDAFVGSYDIDNWYVLGRKEIEEGEKRDDELSFFFFKHW